MDWLCILKNVIFSLSIVAIVFYITLLILLLKERVVNSYKFNKAYNLLELELSKLVTRKLRYYQDQFVKDIDSFRVKLIPCDEKEPIYHIKFNKCHNMVMIQTPNTETVIKMETFNTSSVKKVIEALDNCTNKITVNWYI